MRPLELISAQDIIDISNSVSGVCISLFVPTQKAGLETRQSGIHLKNLLSEAESQLSKQGMRSKEIESVISETTALIDDQDFWQHQGEGLAIFLSSDTSKIYKLPIPVQPRQQVGEGFDILPLLPILSGDGNYYVLAVSENEVRIFNASRDNFTELDIDGVPNGMAEALWADDHEKQQQWHSGAGSSPKGGGRSAMFFGTGDEGNMEQHKVDYKRYFDKVDAALASTFKMHPAPVVLAGVQYLLPIYRQANTSAQLLEGEVHGNQDRSSEEAIHRASWEVAAPHFESVAQTAKDRFNQLLGTGLASADSNEISSAAEAGRIETLFVSGEIPVETEQEINQIAIQTLLKRGDVLSFDSESMPTKETMAATFRY